VAEDETTVTKSTLTETEAAAMETEESTAKEGLGSDVAEKSDEKEEGGDLAISCGFEVIDAKDVPAEDSAEILGAISSMNAHIAVPEINVAEPMETSEATSSLGASTGITTSLSTGDVGGTPSSESPVKEPAEVKTPVKLNEFSEAVAEVASPAKFQQKGNVATEVSTDVKSPVNSPVKIGDAAEVSSVMKTSEKSPVKNVHDSEVLTEVKSPVKSPVKIHFSASADVEESVEIHKMVPVESLVKVCTALVTDTNAAEEIKDSRVAADALFVNGNSNGNSNGQTHGGDKGRTGDVADGSSLPADPSTNDCHASVDKLFTREWVNNPTFVAPADTPARFGYIL